MKNTSEKSNVSKHHDVLFNPWLLYPSLSVNQYKSISRERQKFILGLPNDGQKAIVDNFVFTAVQNPQLPLDVCKTGTSNWFPGTSVERPIGYPQSIEFVVEGKGEIIINDKTFDLEKNDVYILHSEESYVYRALPPERFKRKILFFDGPNSRLVFRMIGLDKVSRIRLSKEKAEYVNNLFTQIDEINRSRQENFIWKISSLTYDFLMFLLNEMHEIPTLREVPDFLVRTIDFATKNLGGHLQVADLAKAACCSESYLTKIFKQNLDMSPHQWLEVQKIQFASVQLQISRKKIYEIADELGYSDTFHFTRVYKRVMGISPSEFRKRSKKIISKKR